MSLVSSMNIAQQALSVGQAAITVISNNIANVDTEGYSRLRVNQASVSNSTPTAGNAAMVAESCSGVTIASVTRYSDAYLQNYYRQENSTYYYLDKYSSIAANVEDLVNELNDTGLSSALKNFYDAVSVLGDSPADITARQNYVDAARNVCSVFNTTSIDLSNIKESLAGNGTSNGSLEASEISSEIIEVNSLLDQLADINYGIVKTYDGKTPSPSLLDQRDSLISKLSEFIPVNIEESENGTVNVALGDKYLIKGSEVKGYLSASATGNVNDPVEINIVDKDDPTAVLFANINAQIDSGSLGAILDVCSSTSNDLTIKSVLDRLNTMASEFASVLNRIQTSTNYPSGTNTPMCLTNNGQALQIATNPLFVSDVTTHSTLGITAANIAVDTPIVDNPYLIAAARVATAAVGNTAAIGNDSNIELIIDARSNPSYYTNLGGTTIEKYLSNTVASVGSDTDSINMRFKSQTSVLNEVKNKLQSAIGVNMDEELTELIKYQRAYQAAARIFGVCKDLLDELVKLGS